MSDNDVHKNTQSDLHKLHSEVSSRARELWDRHADRLNCRIGCASCCVDDLTVFRIEADQIQRHYGRLLATEGAHPPGACAFLDEADACRIYAHRPYVCRTQGLPLRWIEEDSSGTPVEYRDICALNEAGPPLETLRPEDCWVIGPFEGRLATLQGKSGQGLRRVALRTLLSQPTAERKLRESVD